jgi:hypothetical protein
MTSISLVTYTHTDYSDLWPLVFEGINKVNNIEKVFACNNTDINIDNIKNFYNRINLYDDKLTYPKKILSILENINTEYIIFIHDIDIIINFNNTEFLNLMYFVKNYSIDRCIFGMVPKNTDIYNIGNISLSDARRPNITANFLTPYDVGPSIWKVSCLKEALSLVTHCSYREIEYSPIQEFMQNKKVVAFTTSSNYSPKYQIGRPFSEYFSFLHLLSGGKWFNPDCYMDLKNEFNVLIQKYNINVNLRGVISNNDSNFLFSVVKSV